MRIQDGAGNNPFVAGLGQYNALACNGSNILINGSAQPTWSADFLCQVLNDWTLDGNSAANLTSILMRLAAINNSSAANALDACGDLDWF